MNPVIFYLNKLSEYPNFKIHKNENGQLLIEANGSVYDATHSGLCEEAFYSACVYAEVKRVYDIK